MKSSAPFSTRLGTDYSGTSAQFIGDIAAQLSMILVDGTSFRQRHVPRPSAAQGGWGTALPAYPGRIGESASFSLPLVGACGGGEQQVGRIERSEIGLRLLYRYAVFA